MSELKTERSLGYGGPTDWQETETHECFGNVRVSRVSSNGARLFGSRQDLHRSTFRFQVSECSRISSSSGDRYSPGKRIVEFEVSAAQFVEIMTSMNQGEGVPCTLRFRESTGSVARMPEKVHTEEAKIHRDFARQVEEIEYTLQPMRDKIGAILTKKSISKKDREEIHRQIHFMVRIFTDTAPFMLKCFAESADKKLSACKAELDAAMSTFLMAAGLEHLQQGGQASTLSAEALGLKTSSFINPAIGERTEDQ